MEFQITMMMTTVMVVVVIAVPPSPTCWVLDTRRCIQREPALPHLALTAKSLSSPFAKEERRPREAELPTHGHSVSQPRIELGPSDFKSQSLKTAPCVLTNNPRT